MRIVHTSEKKKALSAPGQAPDFWEQPIESQIRAFRDRWENDLSLSDNIIAQRKDMDEEQRLSANRVLAITRSRFWPEDEQQRKRLWKMYSAMRKIFTRLEQDSFTRRSYHEWEKHLIQNMAKPYPGRTNELTPLIIFKDGTKLVDMKATSVAMQHDFPLLKVPEPMPYYCMELVREYLQKT